MRVDEVVEKVDARIIVKTCVWLIVCILHRYGVLYLYPAEMGYNQTWLGLEFQIEQNPYAKQTLTTMENINLSTRTDRHTITIWSTIPAPPFVSIGKSPFVAISNYQHQSSAQIHHRSWTWPHSIVLSSVGINPYRQLIYQLVTILFACRSTPH